ncbi:regulator of G protein signaling family member locomotion defects isoform X3 [Oratosquilla oratoria]|uniref:regulator of G protein signaling family member locomotion defects isoform X3 n=1 Tax=Oratosquilla oratoria TaxID=337810 RepID=UPI003F75CF0D
MQGNRRRKKRPSYGVRTVEITRGKKGFGFTISGQLPCILSCIVNGSPAERAGLRPGDYLIAVNGQNVSKALHDDVVRLIGSSTGLLKLQIAENYYSDSSDDEFVTVNRPKPKYPNRLRHKHQQTRAEKVVRDLQSGAIFSEQALQMGEGILPDQEWPEKLYPPKAPMVAPVGPSQAKPTPVPTAPGSPSRLRPDQIRLLMAETRIARTPRAVKEGPQHPPRPRHSAKKKDKAPKNKQLQNQQQHQLQNQQQQHNQLPPKQPPQQQQQPQNSSSHSQQQNQQQPNKQQQQQQQGHQQLQKQQQQLHQQQQQQLQQQQLHQQPQPQTQLHQQLLQQQQQQQQQHLQQHLQQQQQRQTSPLPRTPLDVALPAPSENYNVITEQEINNLLYPTLAELQAASCQNVDLGEALYRAVVGYLGTIEMPKEPQGGSRLTAIRNCIRRLRIEKKVHTLVLMSVFTERVVLTNPHGLTLAQYPAERITFCGVYADDKKFFGLVTQHGLSGDELSDGSQDGVSVSSSCHVFMVDPRMVQHVDHARRAKNFRLECTPHPENNHCNEFPDSADPILHVIMSLYRNRVGFHLDTGGAPGLIDMEAQMSPQHSNTSSNSSNSDSGIGFRDEGGHHYHHHNDRVFVVEVDDNQRLRIQNFQLVNNLRPNHNDNLRSGLDNPRSNVSNSVHAMVHKAMGNTSHRPNLNDITNVSANNLRPNHNEKVRVGCNENPCAKVLDNVRANMNDNLRVSVTDKVRVNLDNVRVNDPKRLNEMRSSLTDDIRAAISDGRTSVTDDMRAALTDGRASITDDLRAAISENVRVSISDSVGVRGSVSEGVGGRGSVSESMMASRSGTPCNAALVGTTPCWDRNVTKTPINDNSDGGGAPGTDRLTVRAMPDPVGFERSPGYMSSVESPVHVASIRHSMHKYLQHKQEHLVKVSQKINRRDSDTGGIHPLSVRAFSPSTTNNSNHPSTSQAKPHSSATPIGSSQELDLELSLKLSPKVYGLPQMPIGAVMPVRPRAPSERSFTRSLEDLRDSSTSDGVVGSFSYGNGSSYRDGSESDHGLDKLRHIPQGISGNSLTPLARLLHASETNLTRYSHVGPFLVEQRGAFRAVAPRHRQARVDNSGAGGLIAHPASHPSHVSPAPLGGLSRIGGLHGIGGPLDSGDEHTENTENTGEQEGSQDVHPPTQDEFSPDSDSEQVEGGDGNDEVKWDRSNSLRKPFHRTRTSSSNHDPTAAAALSDTELSKISVSLLDVEGGGSETSERAIDVGPVGAWATSFEKLLEDPAGLHTFAEFLKKEFSHENIYFWTACERYKRLSDQEERRSMAKTIFERHLCIGASEPVNVDSHARQVAQEGLHSPDEFLFEQAEKQIFNLMKFDSYSRFLKSNLYKDCMACDLRGQPLPYPGDDTLDPDLRISQDDSHIKLKKSKSDADERRRKSLLPWHRKDRSKSKDRGEAEYRRRKNLLSRGTNNSDSSSIRSDVTGSRTSLNSSDLALVTRHAVSRESLTSGEIGSLSGSEGYNLCRVMLPDLSNSVVAVRPGEAVRTLLTRLLDRRGLNYSTYDVFYHKGDKPVDQTEDSSVLGGQEVRVEQRVLFRLDLPSRKTVCVKAKPHKISQDVLKPILHKYGYKLDLMAIHKAGEEKNINLKGPVTELDNEKFVVQTKEGIKEWGVECGRTYKKRTNTLDEITNRVFEDLLKGKLEQNFDELGVLDFDTRSNKTDRSSDRSSSILGSFSRRNSLAPEKETKPRKPELYEGLKRAQRSRLDDQRGTEINFELPDFLKCDQQQDKENQHTHITDQLFAHFDCSFGENGVIPSHHEAEEYFSMAHPEVWGGVPVSALNSRGSSTGVNGRRSANATLIAAELEFDDLDVTLRDDPLCQVLPEPTSSHVEQLDFVPPPLLSDENLPSSSTAALLPPPPSSLLLSPPPLPPKPKLAALRGPPPRPPSRQLHLIHPPTFSSTSDDEPNPHIPTKHIVQQPQDKFNISFV